MSRPSLPRWISPLCLERRVTFRLHVLDAASALRAELNANRLSGQLHVLYAVLRRDLHVRLLPTARGTEVWLVRVDTRAHFFWFVTLLASFSAITAGVGGARGAAFVAAVIALGFAIGTAVSIVTKSWPPSVAHLIECLRRAEAEQLAGGNASDDDPSTTMVLAAPECAVRLPETPHVLLERISSRATLLRWPTRTAGRFVRVQMGWLGPVITYELVEQSGGTLVSTSLERLQLRARVQMAVSVAILCAPIFWLGLPGAGGFIGALLMMLPTFVLDSAMRCDLARDVAAALPAESEGLRPYR